MVINVADSSSTPVTSEIFQEFVFIIMIYDNSKNDGTVCENFMFTNFSSKLALDAIVQRFQDLCLLAYWSVKSVQSPS